MTRSSGQNDTPELFSCPRCGMVSYHPRDVEEGYCANCHNWTGCEDSRVQDG